MKTSIIASISFLLVVLTLFSCEKNIKKDLVGEWRLLTAPDSYEEIWKFTDNEIILTRVSADSAVFPLASGTYTIKNNTITTAGAGLHTEGVEYYRGDFEIRSLAGTELILLRRDLGLQYYEFEKKQ